MSAETFKATNTQHILQEQAKTLEQRPQESKAIAAQFEVELAAARAEALDLAELAEMPREKKVLDVSGPSSLAYVLRTRSQRRSREQYSGGKSRAGAAVHGDAVIGGVGDAAIPGTAVPTGSASTGASAFLAAAPPAALATADTVATQAVEATVQDAKKHNHNHTSAMAQSCANGPTDEATEQLADMYGIDASKLRMAMRGAMGRPRVRE